MPSHSIYSEQFLWYSQETVDQIWHRCARQPFKITGYGTPLEKVWVHVRYTFRTAILPLTTPMLSAAFFDPRRDRNRRESHRIFFSRRFHWCRRLCNYTASPAFVFFILPAPPANLPSGPASTNHHVATTFSESYREPYAVCRICIHKRTAVCVSGALPRGCIVLFLGTFAKRRPLT